MANLNKILEKFPNARKVADGFLLGDGDVMFHVFNAYTNDQTEGLNNREFFYLGFCSRDEILTIRNQKNSSDYLLWLRAEAIADSPRAVRVFHKRSKNKKNWSLTKYYESNFKYHKEYISEVAKNYRAKIEAIPAGMAFINEVNAMCIKSKFGNVVAVSEALSHFLYYMNVAFLGSHIGINEEDRSAALAIAIRTMLGSESLDFDLDPRGDLPHNIHEIIDNYTSYQLIFTFGHEYAHHTLNHLSSAKVVNINLCDVANINSSDINVQLYKYDHKKEYEADWYAIKNIKGNIEVRSSLADAAFLMFIYFDILEAVYSYLAISTGTLITHPKPLDRLWKLRRRLRSKIGATKDIIQSNVSYAYSIKNILVSKWLPFRMDEIERYGSVYLPSYKGPILRDRIDF